MQIITSKKLTWIDIKGPTENDVEYLQDNFNLHPLVLKEVLPRLDYPKIESFDEYLFLVFFYPFLDKKNSTIMPLELDIIVSKKYIITNHYSDIVPLKAIFDQCNLYEEKKEEYTKEGTGKLLYYIINEILSACLPKLSQVKENIDQIEKHIYRANYQEAVQEIAMTKRDIIGFQAIIEPQSLVLRDLAHRGERFFGKDATPYLNHLLSVYDRVKIILSTLSKMLNNLDSTNQSLLNTKTNEIIKVLTIFSVIVFPLTFFSQLFGMNLENFPIVGQTYDFWIIAGIMAITALVFLFYFKHRKWL